MRNAIVAVGHVTHDLYHHGLEAGGCAFYAARVYEALGVQADLVTLVGHDFALENAVVAASVVERAGKTTTFYNHYPSDAPRLQLVEAVAPSIAATKVAADFLHLAPVLGEIELDAWTQANPHATIAINVQGWIKGAAEPVAEVDPSWPPGVTTDARIVRQKAWKPDPDVLSRVDIACMSDEDLIDQGDLFDTIRTHVDRGCLTFGERGSMVWEGGREWQIPAFKAEVRDTTGAGDTYAAAFCAALRAGRATHEAGRYAAAAASVVIEAEGARGLGELAARLRELGFDDITRESR
jgi:sugar/nucleoside kinase (ribokinase family)